MNVQRVLRDGLSLQFYDASIASMFVNRLKTQPKTDIADNADLSSLQTLQ